VNPAYTSQDCSGCGHRKTDLTLSDRTYTCARCGLVMDRDRNAARNILARGRQVIALG
jgi:putative transposase